MEDKLRYDPRSSVLLDLVEEYIEHYLLDEAETLLKDYLRDNPVSERAIELWIKIAKGQGDKEKEEKLKMKLKETKVTDKETLAQEKIKIQEEDFLKSIKEIEAFDIVDMDAFIQLLIDNIEELSKEINIGKISRIIVEDDKPKVFIRKKEKWLEIKLKEKTKFPTLTWIVKTLKENEEK